LYDEAINLQEAISKLSKERELIEQEKRSLQQQRTLIENERAQVSFIILNITLLIKVAEVGMGPAK
jgi:hypothetical protein